MRHYKNWLDTFVEYASFGEAPLHFYRWVGIATVAGALRRRVWIDQIRFRWIPNFFLIMVGPPGIISKTTTMDIGMELLKKVPGIKFGPDVVTWQSFVKTLGEGVEIMELPNGEQFSTCAAMVAAGELGNLFDPKNRELVDCFVALWDGRDAFRKETKHSGNDNVQNPCVNLIGCTTPDWIAANFPEYMIGGGFASRTIFLYGDRKRQMVAYLDEVIPSGDDEVKRKLIEDLTTISQLSGPYQLTKEARDWGRPWYEAHCKIMEDGVEDSRFSKALARKPTFIHKLAMIIAASHRDPLFITADDMKTAAMYLEEIEKDLPQVFSLIGRTDISLQADRIVGYVRKHRTVTVQQTYRFAHSYFPDYTEFEAVMNGAKQAGLIRYEMVGTTMMLRAVD